MSEETIPQQQGQQPVVASPTGGDSFSIPAPKKPIPAAPAPDPLKEKFGQQATSGGMGSTPVANLYGEGPGPDADADDEDDGSGNYSHTINDKQNRNYNDTIRTAVDLRQPAEALIDSIDMMVSTASAFAAAFEKPFDAKHYFALNPVQREGFISYAMMEMRNRPELASGKTQLMVMLAAYLSNLGLQIWHYRKENLELAEAKRRNEQLLAEAALQRAEMDKMAAQNKKLALELEMAKLNRANSLEASPEAVKPARVAEVTPQPPQTPQKKNDDRIAVRPGNLSIPASYVREESFALGRHMLTGTGVYAHSAIANPHTGKPEWVYVKSGTESEMGETVLHYDGVTFKGKIEDCPEENLPLFFRQDSNGNWLPRTMLDVAVQINRTDQKSALYKKLYNRKESDIRETILTLAKDAQSRIRRASRLPILNVKSV